MFIPIGDQNVRGQGFPYVNYILVAINLVVFFFIEFPLFDSSVAVENFFMRYGAQPCEILIGRNLGSIITAMFLHGGLLHIFGNMFFLFIFGDNIEMTIGRARYLAFYLMGGIVAAFAHALVEGNGVCMPMVGASGAIAAVLGAYLVMYPLSRVRILMFIFTAYIPAWIFLAFWGGQEIYTAVRGISLIQEVGDQVAHMAHAGGFLFGVLAGLIFRSRIPLKRLS